MTPNYDNLTDEALSVLSDQELDALIDFHRSQVCLLQCERAKVWRLRLAMDTPNPEDIALSKIVLEFPDQKKERDRRLYEGILKRIEHLK
jgi:hypothetical protein